MKDLGGRSRYWDEGSPSHKCKPNGGFKGFVLPRKSFMAQDMVVIFTNHSAVDYLFVLDVSDPIIDSRGIYQGLEQVFIA